MIGQEVLPSQVPYTFLDYGVTMVVLVVLGITLYYVFKTQAKVLKDHDEAMSDLVQSMRMMKEELLTAVVEARHLRKTTVRESEIMALQAEQRHTEHQDIVQRIRELSRQNEHAEAAGVRHDAEANARAAATLEEEAQQRERTRGKQERATQAKFRKDVRKADEE